MLFAYIGPETMMPVASIIAAVTGVFMMFGRSILDVRPRHSPPRLAAVETKKWMKRANRDERPLWFTSA